MKKRSKILASLLLALVMVFTLTSTAFAADYTITAPDNDHTYEVYQIFTGDLYNNILSNVKWGKNGTGTEGEAVPDTILKELEETTGSDSAKLAVITKYVTLDKNNKYGSVTSASPLENVPAGYYLIKDVDDALDGQDDAYTTYIVKIVNNVAISPKSAKPIVDKQVQDETTDAEAGASNGWGETADHAINESFQFKLIATLSADTDYYAYKTYKVVFTDTMSTGVTFESIASVTVDGVTLTAAQYTATATAGQAGGLWTLTIDDIKSIEGVDLTDGAVIEVIYNAHLNEAATVGNTDNNNNLVYLEYSNNPNAGGEGKLGKTAPDTVWVFTYELDNTKVDGTNNNAPLAGAGFRLYSDEACTDANEIKLIYDETISAYRPIKSGETGEEMFSANVTGVFNIKGLDAGTYYLKETTTPSGYNTCATIKIEITAVHKEAESTDSATTTITMKRDGEALTGVNQIQNNKGATLPETGGIGTTIFYVLGGALVIGAAVLLITKKRMNAEK